MKKSNSKGTKIIVILVAAAILLVLPFLLPNDYITQIVNMI